MRENRPYGSEGGVGESRSLPLSNLSFVYKKTGGPARARRRTKRRRVPPAGGGAGPAREAKWCSTFRRK